MMDAGWLWLVTDVGAVIVLGGAMAYGAYMWSNPPRNPAVQRASDEAARRLYRSNEPDAKNPFGR